MGKYLQQQSTCTVGRGSGGLGVITVISETVNNATIPISALQTKIQSQFPHYTFLTHQMKKQTNVSSDTSLVRVTDACQCMRSRHGPKYV